MRRTTLIILLIQSTLWAHARLAGPTPRTNNPGIKVGPCGGIPKVAPVINYQLGQTYNITVQETINHPGHFIINVLNANEQKIAELANVVDNIAVGFQTITVQMDSAKVGACSDCVLQLIQSMEENPAAPTYYYSCADITISDPNVVGTPAPSPPAPPSNVPVPTSDFQPPSPSQLQSVQEHCTIGAE